jgi:hypothetical protein
MRIVFAVYAARRRYHTLSTEESNAESRALGSL